MGKSLSEKKTTLLQGGPPTQPLTAEGDMASKLAAGVASTTRLNKAIQYNHIFIQWSTHIQYTVQLYTLLISLKCTRINCLVSTRINCLVKLASNLCLNCCELKAAKCCMFVLN